MGTNIIINKEIENYINKYSLQLNNVQKDIISYNNSLGDIKRNQISISQCHFKFQNIGLYSDSSNLVWKLNIWVDVYISI